MRGKPVLKILFGSKMEIERERYNGLKGGYPETIETVENPEGNHFPVTPLCKRAKRKKTSNFAIMKCTKVGFEKKKKPHKAKEHTMQRITRFPENFGINPAPSPSRTHSWESSPGIKGGKLVLASSTKRPRERKTEVPPKNGLIPDPPPHQSLSFCHCQWLS